MYKKLLEIVRNLGAWDGMLYLLSRVFYKISGRFRLIRYYVYRQPVDSSILPSQRRSRNIEVIEIDSIAKADRCGFPPRPDSVIDARIAQSARCLVAYRKGAFAGFLWFTKDRYIEDEIRCRYVLKPAGEAVWDFDVYVAPQARLGGTFLELWHRTFEVLQKEDIRWSVSRISAFNLNSLKSHERLGAHRVGSVTALCIFSLQILLTTFRPYFSITVQSAPNIVVKIHPEDQ